MKTNKTKVWVCVLIFIILFQLAKLAYRHDWYKKEDKTKGNEIIKEYLNKNK